MITIKILFCAFDATEFNCILACELAKEVRTILQTTHEWISQGKEFKIELLFCDYELFEIKEGESITDMYKWFSNLVNNLKGLRKRFGTIEFVKKILRSLPDYWTMKVTTIEEFKILNNMGIDKLIRYLLTYEMKRKWKEEEIKAKRDITLRVVN